MRGRSVPCRKMWDVPASPNLPHPSALRLRPKLILPGPNRYYGIATYPG